MKKSKRKTTLRARLTIVTVAILSSISVLLTLYTMYSANYLTFASSTIAPAMAITAAETTPLTELDSADYSIFAPGFDISGVSQAAALTEPATDATPAQRATIAVTPAFPIANTESFDVPLSVTTAVESFNSSVLIYMVIIIALGGLITYFALGRALLPVKKLSNQISEISENDLSVRVETAQAGELQSLAHAFNHMLERLNTAFEGQKGFAAAAAHELKTPLSAIKANIDVLELDDTPTQEDYAQTLGVVKKQTARMISLVDELLKMASPQDLDFEDNVDISIILANAICDVDHIAKEKNTNITLETKPIKITANPETLRRAFSNIIENAIKYGGGKVNIKLMQDSNSIKINISDNGNGIAEEYQARIFEPFFRIDSSRSRKMGGAGLGLAIAKSIIEAHGAKISYKNNADKKESTFTINFNS